MSLDVRRMLILEQVAAVGSLTAAASALHLTVSAVSQQIAQLEREAGQPLVLRGPRGVSLTPSGRIVAEHAASVRMLVSATERELRDLEGLQSGSLRLGTIPTVTESFLPDAISAFRSAHPGVALSVHSAQISELRGMFLAREVELAVMWERESEHLEQEQPLVTTPLREDPSVLLVPADHPAASRPSVRLEEFAHEHWIIRASPQVRAVLRDACEQAGFEPVVSFEARGYQEVQAMVAIGMGVALVPTLSLATLRGDVRALQLTPHAPARRIVLVQRRRARLSPAAAEMARVLRVVAAAYEPVGRG
ncbi:LysR family transcriptional regulator [Curtobacterium ammoniigenes]|uniref:LysR family transcriptional regulator n=1 Tax=Curtobacterium ammoniigenes TaxID=395387 RepID=UPI00082F8BED|nr:LysR family transcriptional regulator [Curtobacterium ammoniigenes]